MPGRENMPSPTGLEMLEKKGYERLIVPGGGGEYVALNQLLPVPEYFVSFDTWVQAMKDQYFHETGMMPHHHPSRIRCFRCNEKHSWIWVVPNAAGRRILYCKECFLKLEKFRETYATCG
jgi:hypothetical protein